MGQGKSIYQKQQITPQKLQQSISVLFDDTDTKFKAAGIALHINILLQDFQTNIPSQKTQAGFLLNPRIIRIFYHKGFLFAMGKMINLLMQKLEQMMTRTTLLIMKDEWRFCVDLANLIVFLTDDKIIRIIETASVRSDLHHQTKKILENIQKQNLQFEASENLINKFSLEQIERLQKCMRISINSMINMHLQLVSQTQANLQLVSQLEGSCFILYLKVLYSPEHSHLLISKAKKQYIKVNLNIGQYFLGRGANQNKSSLYESSVIFVTNIMQDNKENLRDFKALPSHLYKNLPIISQNTVYDFIVNVCLFALTYIKQGTTVFSRILFNRIMTLKLLDLMFEQMKITSPQITYYLQEVCLQTKIGQIERSFVTDIVQKYAKMILQKIQNPIPPKSQGDKNKKSQMQLLRENNKSQILQKYLSSGSGNYNVKYSNKKFKITTLDVLTELQNDENMIQTELRILFEKYIYEMVLKKKVNYQYNDRQLWNQILPHIIEDKVDSEDSGNSGNSGNQDFSSSPIKNMKEDIPPPIQKESGVLKRQEVQNQQQNNQNRNSEELQPKVVPVKQNEDISERSDQRRDQQEQIEQKDKQSDIQIEEEEDQQKNEKK